MCKYHLVVFFPESNDTAEVGFSADSDDQARSKAIRLYEGRFKHQKIPQSDTRLYKQIAWP